MPLSKLQQYKEQLESLEKDLDFTSQTKRLTELNLELSRPDFWQDQIRAQALSQEQQTLSLEVGQIKELRDKIDTWLELAQTESGWEKEFIGISLEIEQALVELEQRLYSQGEYDKYNVILSIYSGVGGVDAQDWAQMLERMYLRFCERKGFKAKILDQSYGAEAGIKSVSLEIKGLNVYGLLKAEIGVHRLLRNSPFNADNLRQTSFALVEVIPILPTELVPQINDNDIEITTFHASGPGGQSVNTTDSAVRIKHKASDLVVTCQTERSQQQNKENALKILSQRLAQKLEEEKRAQTDELKTGLKQATWGQQIRSYFLYGNRLVKDHRSNLEIKNVEAVLDGDLNDLISATLKAGQF